MMDFEPLSDIPGLDAAAVPEGGMVARLRYQQTKIDAAPNTILVGRDVVEIIREQQAWVREHWHLGPAGTIRYPEDHRQPARHDVLGDQQLQPRPEGLQPPPGPARLTW
ncbi:hypothetical protein [Streptomyces sp. NBC_01618]|uniref:hypothetical protein n=1 Tax=Streptomyces sp. NBC_01618 TaxID=2975900 RepID=UPI00386D6653|nr:hypothetical protein OH735_00940 [Streptomyces sp. NBC_01618]